MHETEPGSYNAYTPVGGLIVRGEDGVWYGWRAKQNLDGAIEPMLVSQDGSVVLPMAVAARYGVPLPAGFATTQHFFAQEHSTQSTHVPTDSRQSESLQNSLEDSTQRISDGAPLPVPTPEPEASESYMPESSSKSDRTTLASLFAKSLDIRRKYAERQMNPEQWLPIDGWGVATVSFIRGNDVARQQLLQVVTSRSKTLGKLATPFLKSPTTLRRGAVLYTKASPATLPVGVVTPVIGDEVLTLGIATAVMVGIAKRRSAIKNGER